MHRGISDTSGQKTDLIAFPLQFGGPGAYPKVFEGTGYGVVLDDDGETGYFYAAAEDFEEVLDGLHLYNSDSPDRLNPGDKAHIIWNPALLKAGLHYHGEFQAVIDFKGARACCRTGFPPPEPSGWCRSSHHWDPKMLTGLTFERLEG